MKALTEINWEVIRDDDLMHSEMLSSWVEEKGHAVSVYISWAWDDAKATVFGAVRSAGGLDPERQVAFDVVGENLVVAAQAARTKAESLFWMLTK